MKSYRESFGQYLISLLLAVASGAIESGGGGEWLGLSKLLTSQKKKKVFNMYKFAKKSAPPHLVPTPTSMFSHAIICTERCPQF